MDLRGKKIAFLGDSITQGVGVSCVENTYWMEVGRRTGAEVFGYGIGGTRFAVQQTPSANPVWDQHFASRVEEMIPDADMVVVFGGTNDFGHGDAAFGCMTDRTENTFYGACHLLLEKLIVRYPHAQLVVMTPLHRMSEDQTDYNEFGVRRQGSLKRYVDALREVAEFYGVIVVDLFRTCRIQPRVPVLKETYMPDGIHPNDAGHQLIADRLYSVLKGL